MIGTSQDTTGSTMQRKRTNINDFYPDGVFGRHSRCKNHLISHFTTETGLLDINSAPGAGGL